MSLRTIAVYNPVIKVLDGFDQITAGFLTENQDTSMGVRSTIKLFAFKQNGLTFMIMQYWADEDFKKGQAGLSTSYGRILD